MQRKSVAVGLHTFKKEIPMAKRVLMVGWHPTVVDYSKYPGLDADKLDAALRADEKN